MMQAHMQHTPLKRRDDDQSGYQSSDEGSYNGIDAASERQKLTEARGNLPEAVAFHLEHQGIHEPYDVVEAGGMTIAHIPDTSGMPQAIMIPAEVNFAQGLAAQLPSVTQGSHDWVAAIQLYKTAK